ncbi:MAG: hypothetical protein ACRDI2_13345 [Chloroflexota bacterium]
MSLLSPLTPVHDGSRGIASTQSSHVAVESIAGGVVRMAGGHYRAVLEIGSVALSLQSSPEQEATLAGYAAFLNSLTYPVQILVRLVPVDCEGYLGELEHCARHDLAAPLAEIARDHVAFVRRLARERTLLERRFYVVVPADPEPASTRPGWPVARWLGRSRRGRVRPAAADGPTHVSAPFAPLDPADAARRQLEVRCEEIARQLARCDLSARRLGDAELAALFYACWCPDLARVQRLRDALAEHTALVVRGTRRGTGALAGAAANERSH